MKKFLTRAKKRVLSLIDRGLTSKEIAEETGVSVRAVETTRHRINKDLGVHSSYEALQIAKKKKLL